MSPIGRHQLGVATGLWLGAFVVYLLAFWTSPNLDLPAAAARALVNSVTLAFWAGLAWMAQSWPMARGARAWLFHLLLALAFACCWYLSVVLLHGMREAGVAGSFEVFHFNRIAFVWQVFQGMLVYAVLALSFALRHAQHRIRHLESTEGATSLDEQTLLVRGEEGIVPLETDRIVYVEAAGDYTQVVTLEGRFLVHRSLRELMRGLGPAFVRTHRSHAVNLRQLVFAESAGAGRLRLELAGGHQLRTSREGARRIRELSR